LYTRPSFKFSSLKYYTQIRHKEKAEIQGNDETLSNFIKENTQPKSFFRTFELIAIVVKPKISTLPKTFDSKTLKEIGLSAFP
jgi:hypothetical protein